ncbi:hypothetical protein OEZ85_000820 [Tetradesmus obliquus]|uniref:Uncharacterized protein n=1 Tax=Tetradesmus obliquus TaxID=3088 RepID=A0ABY8UJU5_TETOB|nr:hypothetical protein OEZ85_000820 [Tetradesmus obliquus]
MLRDDEAATLVGLDADSSRAVIERLVEEASVRHQLAQWQALQAASSDGSKPQVDSNSSQDLQQQQQQQRQQQQQQQDLQGDSSSQDLQQPAATSSQQTGLRQRRVQRAG